MKLKQNDLYELWLQMMMNEYNFEHPEQDCWVA